MFLLWICPAKHSRNRRAAFNGFVYVDYAPAGSANQISAPLGVGAIAIFDKGDNFVKELVAGDRLAAPWGMRFYNNLLHIGQNLAQ